MSFVVFAQSVRNSLTFGAALKRRVQSVGNFECLLLSCATAVAGVTATELRHTQLNSIKHLAMSFIVISSCTNILRAGI